MILKHTARIHDYFGTPEFRLADTGEWITVVDKGRVTPLDNAEVRALAARYGEPNLILRYEWVPGIPGINTAGDDERDDAPRVLQRSDHGPVPQTRTRRISTKDFY